MSGQRDRRPRRLQKRLHSIFFCQPRNKIVKQRLALQCPQVLPDVGSIFCQAPRNTGLVLVVKLHNGRIAWSLDRPIDFDREKFIHRHLAFLCFGRQQMILDDAVESILHRRLPVTFQLDVELNLPKFQTLEILRRGFFNFLRGNGFSIHNSKRTGSGPLSNGCSSQKQHDNDGSNYSDSIDHVVPPFDAWIVSPTRGLTRNRQRPKRGWRNPVMRRRLVSRGSFDDIGVATWTSPEHHADRHGCGSSVLMLPVTAMYSVSSSLSTYLGSYAVVT